MNDDETVRRLLQAALPPTSGDGPPADLWAKFVPRPRDDEPRWTRVDLALLAAATIMLWFLPGAWLLLTHQL